MKYLKKFESNELNLSEVISNIKDICLEIKDVGFNIDIESPGDTRVKTIKIEISLRTQPKSFAFDQISEVYKRIKDYTSPYGFKYYFKSSTQKYGYMNDKHIFSEKGDKLTWFILFIQKPA